MANGFKGNRNGVNNMWPQYKYPPHSKSQVF